MPGTTAKGVPYSLGADAASTIDDTMTLLAGWVNDRPGTAIVTTAQRNALAAPDLWIGKVVYTTDTVGGARLEVCTGLGPPSTWRGVTVSALVTDVQRDAFGATDVWPGRTIFNTTSNTFQIYTGAAWQVVGSNIPSYTDAQRDALAGDDRWTGLLIWNTTSSTFQIWNGASWQIGTDITPTMTTAARTALAGDDLWLGRMVFDTTLENFYVWDGTVWRSVTSKTVTLDLGWKIAGAPVAVTTDELPYPAEGPISIPAGQTKTLVSVQAAALGTWTTKPTYKLRRFTAAAWGDIAGFGTTAAPFNADDSSHAPTVVVLADGDLIGLWIVNAGTPSGSGPWSLRCHLRVDVAV